MRFRAGDRVYVGSLSCERQLMAGWAAWESLRGAQVTIMVPPLRPDAMIWFEGAVKTLVPWRGLELSFNDLGALALCRDALKQVSLSVGPLLAGQDTDPRLRGFLTGEGQMERIVHAPDGAVAHLVYAPPPASLIRHWATPSALSRMNTLRRLGASRVEICAQPVPLVLHAALPLPVTLYQGISVLTVLPCGNCEECAAWDCAPMGEYGGQVMYRCRNLIYWWHASDAVPDYVDRVARAEMTGGLNA